MKVGFGYEKAFFKEQILRLWAKMFGGDDKNSWNSAKTVLFFAYEFFVRKNKMKVGFGCEKSSFLGGNTETAAKIIFLVSYKNSWNSTKTALFQEANTVKIFSPNPLFTRLFGLCVAHIYIFPMSDFLRKCTAGNNFCGNCCEICTKIKHKKQNFWKKMLQKSYFLKKNVYPQEYFVVTKACKEYSIKMVYPKLQNALPWWGGGGIICLI